MIHTISDNYAAVNGDHIHIPFWKKHNISTTLSYVNMRNEMSFRLK